MMVVDTIIDHLISLGYKCSAYDKTYLHVSKDTYLIDIKINDDYLTYYILIPCNSTGRHGALEFMNPDFIDKLKELTTTGKPV